MRLGADRRKTFRPVRHIGAAHAISMQRIASAGIKARSQRRRGRVLRMTETVARAPRPRSTRKDIVLGIEQETPG